MSITIKKSGVLDTFQDIGRIGFAAIGINPNGAMDMLAMQSANALVGNHLNEAVIELHFPAATFFVENNCLIALCGADFGAQINGVALPTHKTVFIPTGTTIQFTHKNWGERCYLAVSGGFEIADWLGSKSTNLKLGMDLFLGHALKKDNIIKLKKRINYLFEGVNIFPWEANLNAWYDAPDIINFLYGPEWNYLTANAQKEFVTNLYKVKPTSDRMGLQLDGKVLEKNNRKELVSSAVGFGTIQLPGNGLPIVLMADHQTTGGYPRIGQVVNTHLPKLAQASAHQKIHFAHTTLQKAEELLLSLHEEISILQQGILLKLNELQY